METPTVRCALALFGALLISLSGSDAGATILTFDQGTVVNNVLWDSTYGDDVEATLEGSFGYGVGAEGFTPNVQHTSGGPQKRLFTTGYGDLTNVLYEAHTPAGLELLLEITLTADPGFLVELYEFDLAAFTTLYGSDPTIDSVRVTDGANTIFEQLDASISRTTHTTFDFSGAPLQAPTIVILVDALNLGPFADDDFAIDNIRFGQAQVPEPSTALLLASGLVWLGARGRRR